MAFFVYVNIYKYFEMLVSTNKVYLIKLIRCVVEVIFLF